MVCRRCCCCAVCGMSVTSNNKVVAVTEGELEYGLFVHQASLPVVDEEKSLEQCGGEWAFLLELLHDVVAQMDEEMERLRQAVAANDPTKFAFHGHSVKSCSLNMHLPALADIGIRTEALGKQLEVEWSAKDQRLLASREPLIQAIGEERRRLEEYIAELQTRVEAEGGDAEADDGYDEGQT